ncbi:MAG: aminotransferase class IV, partial [Bacteroidia bacterium]|nr:aminotransferase class IV [Bacteroidia bacterium]
MYIRPLLIGINPQLNLVSSTEYLFVVMCNPVGSYAGTKALTSVNAAVCRDFDRAAPNGTGSYKLSANYAGSFHSYNIAHHAGYQEILFLDPATKTKIDEFGSSNFFAIKGNSYITPLSDSVLPSITNKSLQQIAEDRGMTIEKRVVPFEELETFEEVNACGTAVVITPIYSITDKPSLASPEVIREYRFAEQGDAGPVSSELYHRIRAIQNGEAEDIHNWCVEPY